MSQLATPPRYNYPTVQDFRQAVDACQQPHDLTSMWTKLYRGGSGAYAGIHPFASSSPEYKECRIPIFRHAKAMGFTYNKHRKAFQKSAI